MAGRIGQIFKLDSVLIIHFHGAIVDWTFANLLNDSFIIDISRIL